MKKGIICGIIAIIALVLALNMCGDDGMAVTGYKGTIRSAQGNVVELVSGLKVKLIGVDDNRNDVEVFVKNNFVGKNVTLVADSKHEQSISSLDATIGAYVILDETNECLNHLVVSEYHDAYNELDLRDSTGWVTTDIPVIKKDLALYMKQRTFLIEIQLPDGSGGIGTGFFINEDGLAITNCHVLARGMENYSTAFLYKESPDDAKIYLDKKRKIKNVLWAEDTNGMDITIFSVELENNEKSPYFDLAKKRPAVGVDCSTIGNPKGLTASYSAGHVSAFRDEQRERRTVNLIQYEMTSNPGNSGGPVCDKYGQIIGVVEMGLTEGTNLNFGIDVMQIRPILDQHGFKYGGK